jgi:putative transposase
LQLADPEREQLWQIVNRHRTPQQIALRARIILLADEGYNHREIARALNISREMASLWRHRWLAGLKQISSPNKAQAGFICSKYVTVGL